MGITGVKSIEVVDGDGVIEIDRENYVARVKPNTPIRVRTSEYYSQTPDYKKGSEQWIFQALYDAPDATVGQELNSLQGRTVEVQVPKKFCGIALAWIEAFSFEPENAPPTGWFIVGECEPAITKVTWRKPAPDNDGEEIPTGQPEVMYGDTVQLHIDTEGLNGEVLEVEIWDDDIIKNDPIYTFEEQVVHGKLIKNVLIEHSWRAKALNIAEGELTSIKAELYAIINHFKLHNEDQKYGAHLVVENKFTENSANKSGNVPAAVHEIPTVVSRYHPCKYLGITARTKKRTLELFTQEEAMEEVKPFKVLDGKNGEQKKVDIELKEYNTEECRREQDVHKNHKAMVQEISEGEEPHRFEEAIAVEGTDGKLSLDVESGTIATPGTALEYFWPSMVDHKLYRVALETCRYDRDLDIWVYPNIEVEIAFMLTVGTGYEGDLRYERESLSAYHKGHGFKYVKENLSIEGSAKDHLDWDIQAKSKINGVEHQINLTPIVSTVETAVAAYNDTTEYLEDFDPKNAKSSSAAVSKGVLDIDFAIDPPNIAFALGWKFGTAANRELVPIYTGGLKLAPLIGITIAVDLVPIFGKVGTAVGKVVEWMISLVEYLTDSDVYITFEVSNGFYGEANISYNAIDGFDGGKQKLEFKAGVALKAGAKSNDTVFITTTTEAGVTETKEVEEWKVEGKGETSFSFTEELGYDQGKTGKQYKETKVIWNGARITVTCYELISRKKIDYETDASHSFPLFSEKTLYEEKEYLTEDKQNNST